MADWVHCNSCFRQPSSTGKEFALTSCGHIYCDNCVRQGTREKCQMCGIPCTVIQLSSEGKMKPDVELFFTDLAEMMKKQQKQLIQRQQQQQQQFIQVINFQRSHRQRLISHYRERVMRYEEQLEKLKHSHIEERVQTLELELTISQEKHRTCQHELSKQDAITQKARKQLQDLEKKVSILQEENSYYKEIIRRGGPTTGRTPPAPRLMSPAGSHGNTPSASAHRARSSPISSQHSYGKTAYNSMIRDSHSGSNTPTLGTRHVTSGRVSLRTPPSGGRMGEVPGTPSPGGTTYTLPVNFSGAKTANYGAGYLSPMNCSPAHRSSMPTLPSMISMKMPITPKTPGGTVLPTTSTTPLASSTPNSQYGEGDAPRIIQVNHPPRPSFRQYMF